ncbi:MAG: phosphatidate cytidylyltransferase [Phormidesmis sp. RL_2_1]|nr:phosphatidate cytidylyltransferase [Phormidesmis sp. RL_2_1]
MLASFFFPPTVVLGWLALVGGLSEALRRLGYGAEITRKVVHIGAGHVILIAWWLAIPAWQGILASVLCSIVALLSYRYPLLPGINSVGRKSLGTFFYAMSIGLLIFWFWPLQQQQYAAIGILTMTWGDGLAALVGQQWGQRPYQIWGEKKSWEGSLTMLVVSYVVCAGILFITQGAEGATWWAAAVGAIAATVLESASKYGIDNLSVPLGTAAVCFWLGQFLSR